MENIIQPVITVHKDSKGNITGTSWDIIEVPSEESIEDAPKVYKVITDPDKIQALRAFYIYRMIRDEGWWNVYARGEWIGEDDLEVCILSDERDGVEYVILDPEQKIAEEITDLRNAYVDDYYSVLFDEYERVKGHAYIAPASVPEYDVHNRHESGPDWTEVFGLVEFEYALDEDLRPDRDFRGVQMLRHGPHQERINSITMKMKEATKAVTLAFLGWNDPGLIELKDSIYSGESIDYNEKALLSEWFTHSDSAYTYNPEVDIVDRSRFVILDGKTGEVISKLYKDEESPEN